MNLEFFHRYNILSYMWVGRYEELRGGGGTSILKVSGTCRWQGYDFAIIAIKTGCLNQPNHWHRVSKSAYLATRHGLLRLSQGRFSAHNVYDRSAISAPARRDALVRAGPVFQRSLNQRSIPAWARSRNSPRPLVRRCTFSYY